MPGFVRTKKDEARWSKAKAHVANTRQKEEDSFADQDWALVNHVYHQMKKTVNAGNIDNIDELKSALEKARRRLSDEPGEDDEEPEFSEEGGYRIFDPESEEVDEADKWLMEHNPEISNKKKYEEYGEEEAPEEHINEAKQESVDNEPVKQITEKFEPPKGESKFKQPSKEDIVEMRQYTRPWEKRARERAALEAEARKNPILHHEGKIIEARNLAHANKQQAYDNLISSDDYKNADPITQMEMDAKFHEKWHQENPEHISNAMQQHSEAHSRGEKAWGAHQAAKQEKIRDMLRGPASTGMSTEEAMQHVGGSKQEEGQTSASMVKDPLASFAASHPDFLRHYSQYVAPKKMKSIENLEQMHDYDEGAKADISRVLGQAAQLKDPHKKKKVDEFFQEYHPLIAMNAHRVLNSLGLDKKRGDIDFGMLHEAGMHGLFQAINDYDHDHPSKASFATHASHKIKGMMHSALKAQDEVPTEMRQRAKQFESTPPPAQVPTLSTPSTKPKSEDILSQHEPAMADRLRRVKFIKRLPTSGGNQ